MAYAYKVPPDTQVALKDHDPAHTSGLDKDQGQDRFLALGLELTELQEELYGAARHSVLVILQGLDTSGKDGTIRRVFSLVNPQTCEVESFKAPTEEELAHDFLWRVHKVAPRKGSFGVFNRSHYEDVLVARVKKLVPTEVWKARYAQINDFEAMLAANNTIVLKFFLYISKDEQEERLLARERDPTKAWKLSVQDWLDRELWSEYVDAYEDAIGKCSTSAAPWYIVPADKKWYRDLAVVEAVVDTLKEYRHDWRKTLDKISKTRLAEIKAVHEK